MANGHGGARIGAGKPKKALVDKILDGNPGKRPLTVLEFPELPGIEGALMPKPREFLAALQKSGLPTIAVDVYEKTWAWLDERGCSQLVPPQLIELYAQSCGRWAQCEEFITEYGFLAKHPTTGNAQASPYVAMSQSYMKQANNIWFQIYQTVRENCATEFSGASPHDNAMERILNAQRK